MEDLMSETLLSPSQILLYGRVVKDLKIEAPGKDPADPSPVVQGGANLFLQHQLGRVGKDELKPRFARIYGFSYEGHYYDLARPALFLVHGDGVKADTLADRLGVAASAKSFTEDMMVWAYDKGDFSIRMDVQTGTFEHMLLEAELSSDRLRTYFGGAQLRLRGSPGDNTSE
jgi:hypothetical protein